ncbi:MAG: hypothetical protein ACJA2W_003765 [Planctomycetota bacterium]
MKAVEVFGTGGSVLSLLLLLLQEEEEEAARSAEATMAKPTGARRARWERSSQGEVEGKFMEKPRK